MPDMLLTQQEASHLATFLGTGDSSAPPKPKPSLVEKGKQAFRDYNCMACHSTGQGDPAPKPFLPLPKLDLTKGCLSAPLSPSPDYQLSNSQIEAIRQALGAPKTSPTPQEEIQLTLTRLNCIACHQRDDYGGVDPALDIHFHTTEEALGNEARIPPQLTLVGAKLRPEWLDQVLHNGKSIRPYMKTRMPQFGETALAGLPALFAQADKMEPVELPPPGRSENRATREAA